MPASHHSVFYRPDGLPATQPTVSKRWMQNIYLFFGFHTTTNSILMAFSSWTWASQSIVSFLPSSVQKKNLWIRNKETIDSRLRLCAQLTTSMKHTAKRAPLSPAAAESTLQMTSARPGWRPSKSACQHSKPAVGRRDPHPFSGHIHWCRRATQCRICPSAVGPMVRLSLFCILFNTNVATSTKLSVMLCTL